MPSIGKRDSDRQSSFQILIVQETLLFKMLLILMKLLRITQIVNIALDP